MSFFKEICQWFVKSGAATAGKQIAVQEITQAAGQLQQVIAKHAPDFVAAAEPALTQAVTAAIAGALTKTSSSQSAS